MYQLYDSSQQSYIYFTFVYLPWPWCWGNFNLRNPWIVPRFLSLILCYIFHTMFVITQHMSFHFESCSDLFCSKMCHFTGLFCQGFRWIKTVKLTCVMKKGNRDMLAAGDFASCRRFVSYLLQCSFFMLKKKKKHFFNKSRSLSCHVALFKHIHTQTV